MPAFTENLNLYLAGGGSTGTITPDEVVDIDRINQNFRALDTAHGEIRADLDPLIADTGWVSSGLSLVASSDCTIFGYYLRKIGNRVQGTIRITWAGGTVTPDSSGNFTDKAAIITMPAGWQYGGGYDHFLFITANGTATYAGRARVMGSGAGWIDLMHALTSRAITNGDTLYITLDYLAD